MNIYARMEIDRVLGLVFCDKFRLVAYGVAKEL